MAAFKFVHPGTIKEGYLVKSPPLDKKIRIDGWKKRWCVFTVVESDPSLDYYKDEEEALNTLPIKRISLMHCFQVISHLRHKNRKNVFALHLPERIYYFAASSNLEMREWVDAFSSNLKLTPVDGSTLPSVGTPPANRSHLDEKAKSATMPSNFSTSPSLPRSRTPNSPLPPIPMSPELSPRPRRPAIPVPPVPTDATCLNSYPPSSPSHSPSFGARYASAPSSHCENGHLPSSESSMDTLSVSLPPAPPPHKNLRVARSSSDEEEAEELSPPLPPPRRAASPVPPLLNIPPLSPPLDIEGDFPPPTPPPRAVGDIDSSVT